jgi:FkbM family methyltransferase
MKILDEEWLYSTADDESSKLLLGRIIQWREQILKTNEFLVNDEEFVLNLLGMKFIFNASSAFSSIEVFEEIFRNDSHFKLPGFMEPPPEVVLDIGANQGFYSMKVRALFPECRIIAIEPNPREHALLQKNIALNRIDTVMTENIAVAGRHGAIEMEIIPQIGSIGGKRIKIPNRPWVKDEFIQRIRVPSISLDELLARYSISRVNVAKIDVEGFEMDILENAQRIQLIDRFVIEYHSETIRNDLINLMKRCRFELVHEDSMTGHYYGDLYFLHK